MLNKKLLFVVLSTLLCTTFGCGQKGPLYESEPASENVPTKDESKEENKQQ